MSVMILELEQASQRTIMAFNHDIMASNSLAYGYQDAGVTTFSRRPGPSAVHFQVTSANSILGCATCGTDQHRGRQPMISTF